MSTGPANPVARWFGPAFARLHPQLQRLHLHGGTLQGEVRVAVGRRGIARWLGTRIARRMGLPPSGSAIAMRVAIGHTDTALLWSRTFADDARMDSVFVPRGAWPDGDWQEITGRVRMTLTVDIADGGWRWRPLAAALGRVRVPLALLPRVRAGKRIDGDAYLFDVSLSLPGLGELLSYRGRLLETEG